MSENLYASPEAVQRVDSQPLREYRRTLGLLARGLMWVMLSFVIGYAASWACTLMLRPSNDFFWTMEVPTYVGLTVFWVLQIVGMVYCLVGAGGFVKAGRWLLAGCGVMLAVMLIFYLALEWKDGPPVPVMLFFGFGCWCWQVFLLLLAWKTKSRWLMGVAVLVLLTFSVAGFATMAVFGLNFPLFVSTGEIENMTPQEKLNYEWQCAVFQTAITSGMAYFSLYALLLIGLWVRLWKLIARAWEGERNE